MGFKVSKKITEREARAVDLWNAQYPVGTNVVVKRDNGETMQTVTRSEAFLLSGHTAVIQLAGISGCYSLERVTAE